MMTSQGKIRRYLQMTFAPQRTTTQIIYVIFINLKFVMHCESTKYCPFNINKTTLQSKQPCTTLVMHVFLPKVSHLHR